MIRYLFPFAVEIEHIAFFGLVAFAGMLSGLSIARDFFGGRS